MTEQTAFQKVITRSYTDVDTENGINTGQFLEATDGMINMFGLCPFFLYKEILCFSSSSLLRVYRFIWQQCLQRSAERYE